MATADRAHDVPVVIAGAGPAGLVAAVTLARHGVGSLLVERNPALSPLPRATGVSLRTMELLRSWGLEDQVRAGQLDLNSTGGWAADATDKPAADRGTLLQHAKEQGFPELWVPRGILVAGIPVLGNGKIDYAGTAEMVKNLRPML